ncbi:DUF262 domain-containing protein [Pseudomonas jinjuensis]|uniref:GmrSD restriction endonucleases N-terminal domain-containing protein n=1 Tax=Pseudomonas jinjuensis TaxID=198616 RepID=A0A1H0GK54_9PSED|nr:DUF262 domain-containing protein [Pseudomonas jinjuensis]SDO07210.1 Protein of unknown function DUF262 [Pseudomonas jinjuensis]
MINEEEVDSFGVEEALGDAPYEPASERKVLIQQYDYAVRTLMDMVIEGDLTLDPDYQRQYRWPDEKASRFIESILLNIPVPVVYLAEEADGSFSVIDGQQRLTSLFRFLKPAELAGLFDDAGVEELTLEGLKVRSELNGKKYMELHRVDRSAIAKRPIRCIVVLNESDSTLKFEVFERLNTGSASLTDQEVRNCIYRGSLNSLLKKLARNPKFQEMIALPEASRRDMKDAELVLRFFAYRELAEATEYSDNYTEYLNSFLEENREVGDAVCEQLESLFNSTVDLIYEVLGPGVAFRKPLAREHAEDEGFALNLINGAIYESQMIAFSRLIEVGRSAEDARENAFSAFCDDDYWSALFSGTAQKSKAIRRSNVLTALLLG